MTKNGIILSIGVSGAGKSHGIKRTAFDAVRSGRRGMFLDWQEELSEVPADVPAFGATSVEDAAAQMPNTGALAIVRPSDDFETSAEAAAVWATENGGMLVVPEAHMPWPNGKLPRPVMRLGTAWRHCGCLVLLDTQRLANLNKTLTEQATEVRVYATVGRRDHEVLRELGGEELSAAAHEAARRLAPPPKGLGQPGWHVVLDLVRIPPFELVR